jgi:hypothetical protein
LAAAFALQVAGYLTKWIELQEKRITDPGLVVLKPGIGASEAAVCDDGLTVSDVQGELHLELPPAGITGS